MENNLYNGLRGVIACYYPDPSRYMVELDRDFGDTKDERKVMRVNIENVRVMKDKYCKNKYRGDDEKHAWDERRGASTHQKGPTWRERVQDTSLAVFKIVGVILLIVLIRKR